MISALHVDLYQLTSLVPHWDAGSGRRPVAMSFFSRRLPRSDEGVPLRGFLLWVGLRRCLQWLEHARLDEAHLDALLREPMIGAALRQRPDLVAALRDWRFEGRIWAPPEGTPLWAGPAVDGAGRPVEVDGVRPAAQCPYLQVECDLLTAKLIETPLLSLINHMTMVASKAARVVLAAQGKRVLEFGQRRTHPEAAVDAAYAAWIAGAWASSNVEAWARWGVPLAGTMDHFAVQSWERPGVPRGESERAFFRAFYETWPERCILLVDTYDTFGADTGLRNAVAATGGRLAGVRIDSNLSVPNLCRARALLDELGAPQARIAVSGGLDEHSLAALREAPVDFFGIGERIVTSPDAPVGVGAVAKLCVVDGRPSMKLSRGSGKASLPGLVQVFRQGGVDTVGLREEVLPGEPLLRPVWEGSSPLPQPEPAQSREWAQQALAALPPGHLEAREVQVPVSDSMVDRITQLVRSA